jgi:hypothetical protein
MEIYKYTEFQQNPKRNKDSRVHLSPYIKHPCKWANFHKKHACSTIYEELPYQILLEPDKPFSP